MCVRRLKSGLFSSISSISEKDVPLIRRIDPHKILKVRMLENYISFWYLSTFTRPQHSVFLFPWSFTARKSLLWVACNGLNESFLQRNDIRFPNFRSAIIIYWPKTSHFLESFSFIFVYCYFKYRLCNTSSIISVSLCIELARRTDF